jgi:phospholipid/cholesterol/gamma-HCH transport system permease protein
MINLALLFPVMKILKHLGKYAILMFRVFGKPEKHKILYRQTILEIQHLGLDSLGIVAIISVFMGAVVAIQTAYNIDSPLVPAYTVGFITRQSIVLEFSPTIISLILAGKIGSRIASEIGTMRVTEQIDALEVMGINSANYLILPKIIAAVFINPFLIALSMFLGLFGGWMTTVLGSEVTTQTYFLGLKSWFYPYEIYYALGKTAVFAFLITTIAGYHGYTTKGGALEVGRSSTKAVVYSSILIILFNLILSQLILG